MARRIYAYTVIGKDTAAWERRIGHATITGAGLVKVGETKRSVRARIRQQLGTAYPNLDGVTILLDEPAIRADGTEFSDHEVHAALGRVSQPFRGLAGRLGGCRVLVCCLMPSGRGSNR